jgi:DNA-binding MarR family transcriptional regulator
MTGSADVRQVLDSFRSIVQALRMDGRDVVRGARLSSAQLFALQRIAEHPSASINDIAALTFTHQSSVSVVVQKLVERGFVSKAAARDDSRRQCLELTAAGKRALQRTPAAIQERLIDAIAALPSVERQALARSLDKVARSVAPEAADRHPPMFFEDGEKPLARRLFERSESGGDGLGCLELPGQFLNRRIRGRQAGGLFDVDDRLLEASGVGKRDRQVAMR